MNLLMFNMSNYTEWQKGTANRNYHILNTLEKSPQVQKIICVDFLPYTAKRAMRNYYECIIKGVKGGEIIFGDLTSKFRQISPKIYNYSTIDSIFSEKTVVKEINKILKLLNIPNNELIVWSYNQMFPSIPATLEKKLFVFDMVDNWEKHPSFANYKKRLKANHQLICDKADIIFTVANELVDYFKSMGRQNNIYWLNNGVDLDVYQNLEIQNKPNELSEIKHPIAGYIGTIQDRIDFDLVKYAAEHNPQINFAMIGPIWPQTQKLIDKKFQGLKNIFFLGKKPFYEAPAYISKFDLAFVPHKVNDFLKYTSLSKMYEFFALGKPIVTTRGSEVESFKDYLYIADTNEQFSNLLNTALNEDKSMSEKRLQMIKEHSWGNRVEQMLKIIKNKMS